MLLDKTGTLTQGIPEIESILPVGAVSANEMLRLAASVDQFSAHVLAESLVGAAQARSLVLTNATDVHEDPGQGITGIVDGRRVTVGSERWLEQHGLPAGFPTAERECRRGSRHRARGCRREGSRASSRWPTS